MGDKLQDWLKVGVALLGVSLGACIVRALSASSDSPPGTGHRTWLAAVGWVQSAALSVGMLFVTAFLANAVWDAHRKRD